MESFLYPESRFFLVGITPEVLNPSQLSQLNLLFQEGLDYLYIRTKQNTPAAWQQLLDLIDAAYYPRLLLPREAPQEAAGGKYIRHVREKERGLGPEDSQQPAWMCSTSVHDLALVPQLPAYYRLVFYSPLFPSISKVGYQPRIPFAEVQAALQLLKQQSRAKAGIIGLGGIDAGNIARVQAAGFQGAALLGALWQSPSPVAALATIRQALDQ